MKRQSSLYDSPKKLFKHIVETCDEVSAYIDGISLTDFENSGMARRAVERCCEIIGEAANKLLDEERDLFPEIDWHLIRGMRNRIAHDYRSVAVDVLFETATKTIPALRAQVANIIGAR